MGTILTEISNNEYGYDKRLHVKGASEIILDSCSHYLDENGDRKELTDSKRSEIIDEVIEFFARCALTTICLAYKDLKEGECGSTHEDDHEDGINKAVEKSGLTCIAILGIRDVIREEIPNSVEMFQKAGIKVRMITGDNKLTATAIAGECKIIQRDHHEDAVMEGPEFYERVGGCYCSNCNNTIPCRCPDDQVVAKVKNKYEFKKILKHLDVLARARPEDKYLLVAGIKEMGDVVAVTGNGSNDAYALKAADIGFSMGITGTEACHQASDIILLDDNFASIVNACMIGRGIHDNFKRFLQFQLIINLTALICTFIGA
jgi:P-type Ca2+ transporter type 2B